MSDITKTQIELPENIQFNNNKGSRFSKMRDSLIAFFSEDNINRHKTRILAAIIAVVVVIGVVLISFLRTYKDYTVRDSVVLSDTQGSEYAGFKGNILRYSADGAFYTDYSGNLIWNETFDMKNPKLDICGDYAAIYDVGGTSIYILTSASRVGLITTSLPIVAVNVAKKGSVGILMQQQETGVLQICDVEGNVLAQGELHLQNTGYPVAIALSDNADKMAVSLLDLNSGAVNSTLNFYDFSSAGKKKKDNIVASYAFSNMIIPQIDYIKGNKLVAFGDSQVVLFSGANEPKIKKEVFIDKTVDSVFTNGKYFGYIYEDTDEDGGLVKKMILFTDKGLKRFDKKINLAYTNVYMLSNNEIVLSNEDTVNIYNTFGIKRFAHTFDSQLYTIVNIDGIKNYIFIRNGILEDAHIK